MNISLRITQRNCLPPYGDPDTGIVEPELIEWWEEIGQHSDVLRAVLVDSSSEPAMMKAVESPSFLRDNTELRNRAFTEMMHLVAQVITLRFTNP